MFHKLNSTFSRAMQFVASLALVVMMLVVVCDVALRFFFNTPVRGAYDAVSFALLIMVFFGIGPVISQGKDIVIDLFDRRLPERALNWLKTISAFGTVGTFLFIGWAMWGPARDAWRYGDRSLELGLPLWTYWAVAFFGLACILWAAIALIHARLDPPTDTGEET